MVFRIKKLAHAGVWAKAEVIKCERGMEETLWGVERCEKRDGVVPDQAGVRLVMNMWNRFQRG